MPFDPNSAKKAGKKSKRGAAKKEGPSIKEKMEMLYEKVLDDLLVNQEKLTKTERVKDSAVYLSIEFKYNLLRFLKFIGFYNPKQRFIRPNCIMCQTHRSISLNSFCGRIGNKMLQIV